MPGEWRQQRIQTGGWFGSRNEDLEKPKADDFRRSEVRHIRPEQLGRRIDH